VTSSPRQPFGCRRSSTLIQLLRIPQVSSSRRIEPPKSHEDVDHMVFSSFGGGHCCSAASPEGLSGFFLLLLRFSRAAAAALSSEARASAFSLSSAASSPAASPSLAARFEMSPNFVVGRYAPPANFTPHFRQLQTPTASRLTAFTWHLGHSCGKRIPATTSAYRLLATVPYLEPKLPAGPTFLTFIFQRSLLL